MSPAVGQQPYQSPETRALAGMTVSSYTKIWGDQTKVLSKLVGDVTFQAANQRKMQRGIDAANQNIIQQIQSMFTDFLVLLGGQGDTGFDFGDMKYVFQLLGSLFGFVKSDGSIELNPFNLVWHMISNFLLPVDNFREFIDQIIDAAIATMLDVFGELPIIGQAVQQFAVFISNMRDILDPIADAIQAFFDAFNINLGNVSGIGNFFGPLKPIFDMFAEALSNIHLPDATPVFRIIAGLAEPVAQGLVHIIDVATNLIKLLTGQDSWDDWISDSFNWFDAMGRMITNFIKNGLLGKNSPLNAFNIFGLLKSINIPLLGIGSLSNKAPNLLVEPGFDDEDSIEISDGWIWDTSDGRTKPGCAKATANGLLDRMLRSVRVPVAADQELNISVWVKWFGLFYGSTNPITVDLIRYGGDVEISRATITSVTSPATNQTAWMNLTATYTVPDDGTDQVELQFRLRNTASAGSAWFDDASLTKTPIIKQGWVQNLLDDLGGLGQFIQNVIDNIISAIRGIPFVGGTLAHLLSYVTGWRTDTDHAASQASDAYIGLDVTQKIVMATATGVSLASIDPTAVTTPQDDLVNTALAAQTQSIADLGAQVNALQSSFTGSNNTGVSAVDLFEQVFTNQLDPAQWQQIWLEGTSADVIMETANGHDADMTTVAGGTGNGTVLARYAGNGAHTQTPYQEVTVTMAAGLRYPGVGDGRRPHHAAYCRVSDDGTKWVRAYFDNVNRLVVDYQNGVGNTGVLYNSGADKWGNPGPGSSLKIKAGIGTDLYQFAVYKGNQPLVTVPDTSHVTDVTQTGHGMGMRVHNSYATGRFAQYSANDAAPGAVPGTYLKVAKIATASQTITEGQIFPASLFGNIYKQAGIDFDLATQKVTARVGAIYSVKIRIKASSTIPRDNNSPSQVGIFVTRTNGSTEIIVGEPFVNPIVGASAPTGQPLSVTGGPINAVYGAFDIDLQAGEYFQPYLVNNNGSNFGCVGTANAGESYMTVTTSKAVA